MAFYEFHQNNSGGSFTFTKGALTQHIVIEADDLREAVYRAERLGVYFDGVDKGYDCSCCGDRWYEPYKEDGSPQPTFYGEVLEEGKEPNDEWGWGSMRSGGPVIYVHYKSGRVVGYLPYTVEKE